MKFVLLIPFSVYAIFVVAAIAIGGTVLYIGLIALVLLLLIFNLRLFFSLILLGLGFQLLKVGFKYWYIATPICILLAVLIKKTNKESNALAPLHLPSDKN